MEGVNGSDSGGAVEAFKPRLVFKLQASSWKAEWITYCDLDFLLGAAAGATVDCF
jgi:hypothetical protein